MICSEDRPSVVPAPAESDVLRSVKMSLTLAVAVLFTAACCFPAFWGRGGFLEGGTDVPGWAFVLFPCFSGHLWLANLALYFSMKWLWRDRYLSAFLMASLGLLLASTMFLFVEPGRFELRAGYYLWLASLVLLTLGLGGFVLLGGRADRPAKKDVPSEL